MPYRRLYTAALCAALLLPASAQAQANHSAQPQADLQGRAIKALSDQQIADLRAGRGMSLALPAELNGYPGPSHVLALAEPLHLTAAQRERTQALFAAMQREAAALGESIIAQEATLDRLFATRAAQPDSLQTATSAIATTQGALRAAHLRYHITMLDVLSPAQVQRYAELRGYGANTPSGAAGHDHRGGAH